MSYLLNNRITCTLNITSSGNLVVDALDGYGNTAQATEAGYDITVTGSTGTKREILSQPPPACQVEINGGAAETTSLDVDLAISSDQVVYDMYITNNDDFTGGDWQQFNTEAQWTLLNTTYSTKTVYVAY